MQSKLLPQEAHYTNKYTNITLQLQVPKNVNITETIDR